jgi:hypothetical protein
MTHATRFTVAALVGFVLIGCQGASGTETLGGVASTKSGILTTQSARIPVPGRNYITLYSTNPRGKLGAQVGVQAIREDGSAVIVNTPLAGPGEFLTQSQVGIQRGQSRTWFSAETSAQPRQRSSRSLPTDNQSFGSRQRARTSISRIGDSSQASAENPNRFYSLIPTHY